MGQKSKPETSLFPAVGSAASSESAIQGDALGSLHTSSFLVLRRPVAMRLCLDYANISVPRFLAFSLLKAFRNLIPDTSMAAVFPLSQASWAQEYF